MNRIRKNTQFQGHVSPFERQILTRLTDRLSGQPSVQSILLFGSRSRAASHEDSDLDVAVIVDELSRSTVKAIEQAKWRCLSPEAFLHVNLTILSCKQLDSGRQFSRALKREGVSIWTRNEEKKSRKNSV